MWAFRGDVGGKASESHSGYERLLTECYAKEETMSYVNTVPWPTTFSLSLLEPVLDLVLDLVLDFPVLRLDHPSAVLLALEVTLGRGKPYPFLAAGFGASSCWTPKGEKGSVSSAGGGEKTLIFGLMEISLRGAAVGSSSEAAKGLPRTTMLA
jgi:hypothetical protein